MNYFRVLSLVLLSVISFGDETSADFNEGLTRQKRQVVLIPDRGTRAFNPPRGARDSITRVVLRDYRDQRRVVKTSRVELIEARITANTLNPRRGRDFNRADRDHMRAFMEAGPNDEAGHLIAATLGGTGRRHNLAPQDRTLNRNFGERLNPHVLDNIWFTEENRIRQFVQNNANALVVMTVTPRYNNINSRRPSSFETVSQFSINGRRMPNMDARGTTRNQPPRMGL